MAEKDVQIRVGMTADKAIKTLDKLGKSSYRLGNNLEKFGGRLGKAFDPAMKALTVGIAAASAAIGTLGAKALGASNEIDEAMASIARATGATGDVLQGINESFDNIAGNVVNSFSETAGVIGMINTRLGVTGKNLETISEEILDAARMNEENAEQYSASFARMVGDWGISVERAKTVTDEMFVLAQKTGVSMTRLANMMVQYGSPMRQLGYDFQNAASLLAQFEKEGVNAELVLGSLRIALGQFAREGVEDTTQALQDVIKQIQEAGSTGEANAIALETFGSRAGADMAAAIREGRFAIGDLVKSLENASGQIQQTAEDTETLPEKFIKMRNNISVALRPTGDLIGGMVEEITGLVNVTAEWEQETETLKGIFVSFFDGFKAGLPSMDDFRDKLESFNWDKVRDSAQAVGKTITSIKDAFVDLAGLVPWQFLIDHAETITKVIVIGWASGKILNIAGAFVKLGTSLIDAAKGMTALATASNLAKVSWIGLLIAGGYGVKKGVDKLAEIIGFSEEELQELDEFQKRIDEYLEEEEQKYEDHVKAYKKFQEELKEIRANDFEDQENRFKTAEALQAEWDRRLNTQQDPAQSTSASLQDTVVKFVQTISTLRQNALTAIQDFGVPAKTATEQFKDAVLGEAQDAASGLVETFEDPQMEGIFYSTLAKLGKEGGNKLLESLGRELLKVEDKVKEVTKSIEQMSKEKQEKYGDWGEDWTSTVIREDSESKVVQFTNGIVYSFETIQKAQKNMESKGFDWQQALSMDNLDKTMTNGLNKLVPVAKEVGNSVGQGLHDNLVNWGTKAVTQIQNKLNSLKVPSVGSSSSSDGDVEAVARAEG
jgi:TP901 family phage tail tape measure protein